VDVLGGDEAGFADQRRVRRFAGDDPPAGQVPPLHALVPQADVRRVGEVLVGALPVPHLVPGVPRIGKRIVVTCPASIQSQHGVGSGPGRPLTGTGCTPRSVPARSAPPNARRAAARRSTAPHGRSPAGEHGDPRRRGPCSGAARHHPAVPVRRTPAKVAALLSRLDGHRSPDPDAGPGHFPLRRQPGDDHGVLVVLRGEIDPASGIHNWTMPASVPPSPPLGYRNAHTV
jgi:hypothetical protein